MPKVMPKGGGKIEDLVWTPSVGLGLGAVGAAVKKRTRSPLREGFQDGLKKWRNYFPMKHLR